MCALCSLTGGATMTYLDPGAGYVFASHMPALLTMLASFLGTIFLFFKNKRQFIITLLILILISVGTILFMYMRNSSKEGERVVVLGIDGLDPNIVKELMSKNALPHLKKLSQSGYFSKLTTTTPPQSPVAWASFATGLLPSGHGIYDFIERDPATYTLDLSFSTPTKNMLTTPTWWNYLTNNNIESTILFMPNTYPPSPLKGKLIAGMGVPDVLGTVGTFTLYSTKKRKLDPKWRGRLVPVSNDTSISTSLVGPRYTRFGEEKNTSIPLQIKREKGSVLVRIQKIEARIQNKTFSPWIPIEFSIDFFTNIKAMVRFYVKENSDKNMELYMSALNFDPYNSPYPISYPTNYSSDLANRYGRFYTQGLPHDTWALEEGIFTDNAYLEEGQQLLSERTKMILGELDKTKSGAFFGYVGIVDTTQHMFWKNKKPVYDLYKQLDSFVGDVEKKLKPGDTLLILSDHGFTNFDYEFNVNTWLKENGYLTLKNGYEVGEELLGNINWNKTKEYAVGYNSLYINRRGREGQGIVSETDAPKLIDEISEKLQEAVNPETGTRVIKKMYPVSGNSHAPDLILGFSAGIRSGWDSAVGSTPKDVITKRVSHWNGDHLFDASEVPGVLFSNRKLNGKKPHIIDLAPTILDFLNVPIPRSLTGQSLR